MNEKITVYLSKITNLIKNLDKKKKIIYGAVLGGIILLTVILVIVLNRKDYVKLYSGLETKECAQIVEKLDEMGVDYQLKNSNTIYVDKKEYDKVNMDLAQEGFPKSTLNYDVFSNNVDFMTTDYEKKKYDLYQLQERLQASIKTLEDVEDAIVTITLPDNSLAVLEEDKVPASASVILTLDSQLSKNQISGIEQLVSKSVPGLNPENVSIVDETGVQLNGSSAEDSNDEEVSTQKTKMETQLANTIKNKIKEVLTPLYGSGGMSVGVNAVLDMSKRVSEKVEYQPSGDGNTGVINHQEGTYKGQRGEDGAQGIAGTATNADIPTYQSEEENDENAVETSQSHSIDYSVSKVTEQIEKNGAEIKDITVSVIVNKAVMSEDELDSITNIVANVAGVKPANVFVYNAEFNTTDTPVQGTSGGAGFMNYLLYLLLSLLLVALVAFVIFILIRQRRKKKLLLEMQEPEQLEEQDTSEFVIRKKDEPAEPTITETEDEQLKREIKEFASKSPDITAMLLRTLLKGEIE